MRMASLSNFTKAMLDTAVKNSGLEGFFEAHLTTDRVGAYKPDPRAYQMGIDAFGVKREEILFAAFGGWDAAGATSFGYPTFWVNRMSVPPEELGIAPDATGADLRDLVRFLVTGVRQAQPEPHRSCFFAGKAGDRQTCLDDKQGT